VLTTSSQVFRPQQPLYIRLLERCCRCSIGKHALTHIYTHNARHFASRLSKAFERHDGTDVRRIRRPRADNNCKRFVSERNKHRHLSAFAGKAKHPSAYFSSPNTLGRGQQEIHTSLRFARRFQRLPWRAHAVTSPRTGNVNSENHCSCRGTNGGRRFSNESARLPHVNAFVCRRCASASLIGSDN
jgi:hypothetical protein